MAKRLFFVCAGMLALALAFHLGTTTVSAQGATTLSCAEIMSNGYVGGVINRVLVRWNGGNGASLVTSPVPGTSPVICVDPADIRVVLENGDVWKYGGNVETGWSLQGNMLTNVLAAPMPSTGAKLGVQVMPVPSREQLAVTFQLEREGDVQVELLDAEGRLVARQAEGLLSRGPHSVRFAIRQTGTTLHPGTYFVRVIAGRMNETARVVVLE